MLSMPPATTYLKSPQRRSLAAIIAARIPEPQTLLRVMAPVATGQPAASAAWRAGACPWPAVSTHPMLTCWISSGVRPARSTAAAIARAPEGVRGKACKRALEHSDRGAHRAQDNDVVHDLSCEAAWGGLRAAGAAGGRAVDPSTGRSEVPARSADNGYNAARMDSGMRALGIDFGEKRIGLAISDPEGRLAVPLATLERRNDRSALRADRRDRPRARGSSGWSSASRWTSSATAARWPSGSAASARGWPSETGLPVEMVDEALTSVEAARRLRQAGVDTRREPGRIDAVAAQILLQDVLDRPVAESGRLGIRLHGRQGDAGGTRQDGSARRQAERRAERLGLFVLLLILVPAGLAGLVHLEPPAPLQGVRGAPSGWSPSRPGPAPARSSTLEREGVLENGKLARLYLLAKGSPRLQAGTSTASTAPMTTPQVLRHAGASGQTVSRFVTIIEGLTAEEIADQLARGKFGRREVFLAADALAAADRRPRSRRPGPRGVPLPRDLQLRRRHPRARRSSRPWSRPSAGASSATSARVLAQRAARAQRAAGGDPREHRREGGEGAERPAADRRRLPATGWTAGSAWPPIPPSSTPSSGSAAGTATSARTTCGWTPPTTPTASPACRRAPSARPALASLIAAAAPADVPYLYFVGRNDGTHVFARTLAEHNRNVEIWQKKYWRDRWAAEREAAARAGRVSAAQPLRASRPRR